MIRERQYSVLRWCGLLMAAYTLAGCAIYEQIKRPTTRTEEDFYTVTERDTVVRERVRNVPGATEDTSVVAANSRTMTVRSHTSSEDSNSIRYYPNFLRVGGLEVAGLFGTTSLNGAGTGLLGLYSFFNNDNIEDSGSFWSGGPKAKASNIIKGELVRFMPVEYRLRWFDDAPNWTLGSSVVELLAPDEDRNHHALLSVMTNAYVRRRIFIRDQIPYVIFSPFLGASLFPSAYVNLGGELLLGSLAGLNLRAYAGLASGFWWLHPTNSSTFTYFGLGASVMDFTNRVEETEHEWKDYVYTGINFNIVEASLIKSTSTDTTVYSSSSSPFTGGQVKLASVEIPLPFANYHFWAGTSLLNWLAFGFNEQGLGILPVRLGYRQYLFSESLMLEPFVELNYYPSQIFNVGARVKLDLGPSVNVGLTAGFASGSPGSFDPRAFNTTANPTALSMSAPYFGLNFFFGDWNYTPEFIREARAREIPSTMK